jgi:uncharacterized protein
MQSFPTNLGEQLKRIADWCRRHPVRLCVLFGSQATGKAHADSDIDLALWPGEPLATRQKLRWVRELSDLVDQEVNVVFVSPALDPVLGFEIVRDGRLIFEVEPGLWAHLRSQLWHAYNDSLPFRRGAQEQLRQFVKEVRRGA